MGADAPARAAPHVAAPAWLREHHANLETTGPAKTDAVARGNSTTEGWPLQSQLLWQRHWILQASILSNGRRIPRSIQSFFKSDFQIAPQLSIGSVHTRVITQMGW